MRERIKRYTNILSKKKHKELLEILSSYNFPWYFNSSTRHNEFDQTKDFPKIYQFVHGFYKDGEINSTGYEPLILPLIDAIKKKTKVKFGKLVRAKVNMLTKQTYTHENIAEEIHVDFPKGSNYLTVIYYVNTSDGNTDVSDIGLPSAFEPIENTCIVFDSDREHFGLPPQQHQKRIVINLNFEKE